MAELERTRQADFEVGKNVLEYTDLAKGEEVWGPQVEAMLDEWYEKKRKNKLHRAMKRLPRLKRWPLRAKKMFHRS